MSHSPTPDSKVVFRIPSDDGSPDVFVHTSAVERSGIGNLHEGQKVSFELERGDRGSTSAVALKQG